MARCDLCGENVGLGGSRKVELDGHRLCAPCADGYRRQRRQRVLDLMSRPESINAIVTVPDVTFHDPDLPKEDIELMVGPAILTDKGVIFIETARYDGPNPGWGMQLGPLGMLIAEWVAHSRKKRAVIKARSVVAADKDLTGLLARKPWVRFYPLEEIQEMKVKSKRFELRFGARRITLKFEACSKGFARLAGEIRAYADDVNRRIAPRPLGPGGQP